MVTREDAERIYASVIAGTAATAAEQKALQDYLFPPPNVLKRASGPDRPDSYGVGADPYFNVAGSRPSLLEPALNDPALQPGPALSGGRSGPESQRRVRLHSHDTRLALRMASHLDLHKRVWSSAGR